MNITGVIYNRKSTDGRYYKQVLDLGVVLSVSTQISDVMKTKLTKLTCTQKRNTHTHIPEQCPHRSEEKTNLGPRGKTNGGSAKSGAEL